MAVALTASLEKACLEAWGRETPWEIRLHLLPSVLSPSESSADFSVEPYLECSMRVRPSASLPVISCILELLLQPHTVIMLGFFFFLFKYDVCASPESRLPPGMICTSSAWRGKQR